MVASAQCKSCGYENSSEARFCANCGSVLVPAVEPAVPSVTPTPPPAVPETAFEYAGFWIRFGAAIIDIIVVQIISAVLSYFLLGGIVGHRSSFLMPGFLSPISWLYHWLFIGLKGQTLGKMAVGIKVVNIHGDKPGLGIAALREIPGKILSSIAICIGFLWIIWDGRKQGWHDKIANTYVVGVKSGR